jgi:hypothetical protein
MTPEQEQGLRMIGRNAMDSIREMVAALECDYERLEKLRQEQAEAGDVDKGGWMAKHPVEAKELKELEEAAGECTSREEAEERIHEDPLSLLYRSGWVGSKEEMGPEEFELLLSTGGPATRIVGKVDRGEPTSARVEAQDWFLPWTVCPVSSDDEAALLTYCRCFCMEW